MKELDFYTELICYNGVAGDYHEKLCAAVHGMLWHIKKTHNFTNDELGFILSIDEEDIEDMLT